MPVIDTTEGLFPAGGPYVFRIAEVPRQGKSDTGKTYWDFSFECEVDGEKVPYRERLGVWKMAPICEALGFQQIKVGKYDFEPTDCLGKSISAKIIHETIEKGKYAGKTFARMDEITDVPF